MPKSRVVCAAALLIVLPLLAAAQEPVNIAFTVAVSRPHTHLFEIEIAVKRAANGPRQELLVMPVWTPGSYMIREFERNVQDFAVADSAGNPLKWEKTNKNTWRVFTNGAREWQASYRVYANELSVRTSELNSEHAFWNNANLLMYLDSARACARCLESRDRIARSARAEEHFSRRELRCSLRLTVRSQQLQDTRIQRQKRSASHRDRWSWELRSGTHATRRAEDR
jgi:hypothetical protein